MPLAWTATRPEVASGECVRPRVDGARGSRRRGARGVGWRWLRGAGWRFRWRLDLARCGGAGCRRIDRLAHQRRPRVRASVPRGPEPGRPVAMAWRGVRSSFSTRPVSGCWPVRAPGWRPSRGTRGCSGPFTTASTGNSPSARAARGWFSPETKILDLTGLTSREGRCAARAGSSHVRSRCHRPRYRPGGRRLLPGRPSCPSGPSRRRVLARSRRCERCHALPGSTAPRASARDATVRALRTGVDSSPRGRRVVPVSWSAAISQLDSRLRGSWSALDDADSPSSDLECVLERDASPITRTKRREGRGGFLTSSWYAKRRPAPEGRPPHSVLVRPRSIQVTGP